MLLLRNCCRILWKPLNCHQYTVWLFLLLLLSQKYGSHCKPSKLNHRIQRRFMWKQMDSTVDGFVDHVVTGARAMKNMIGDFMPSKQSPPNVMDYLPTETTRIKYIIRNPHTKETKVIRLRPSKKVVKIMTQIKPKPLMADKQKSIHMMDPEKLRKPELMADKQKSIHMMDPEKLRKLEKEQELIAEGRIPMKYRERPNYIEFKTEKDLESKVPGKKSQSDNEVLSGTIQEFGDSWKPVYSFVNKPGGFSTAKPQMMSSLHTSVLGEFVAEPPNDSQVFSTDEPKKSNTYEVTEYTAEESVVQPSTHDYYNHRSQAYRESEKKYSSLVTEVVSLAAPIENESYILEYQTQRGFVPSRSSHRTNEETTTTSTSTTTTTEEPNYPLEFLKKYREHPENYYHSKLQQPNKPADALVETSWSPSNASYSSFKSRPTHYHPYAPSNTVQRTKSQKWPPDGEENHQQTASSHAILNATDALDIEEFTTQSLRYNDNFHKNVRLKTHHSPIAEQKFRNVKQRGSVKYGDRI